MDTDLILALVLTPGVMLFIVLLCALRLNAVRPFPRPSPWEPPETTAAG